MGGGCEAEAAVVDGSEKLNIVVWGEGRAQPLLEQVDCDSVKLCCCAAI